MLQLDEVREALKAAIAEIGYIDLDWLDLTDTSGHFDRVASELHSALVEEGVDGGLLDAK